jgi:hypothetical protein
VLGVLFLYAIGYSIFVIPPNVLKNAPNGFTLLLKGENRISGENDDAFIVSLDPVVCLNSVNSVLECAIFLYLVDNIGEEEWKKALGKGVVKLPYIHILYELGLETDEE